MRFEFNNIIITSLHITGYKFANVQNKLKRKFIKILPTCENLFTDFCYYGLFLVKVLNCL